MVARANCVLANAPHAAGSRTRVLQQPACLASACACLNLLTLCCVLAGPSLAGLCNLRVELYMERVSRKLGAAMGLLPQAALQNRALQALKPEVGGCVCDWGGWVGGAALHRIAWHGN